MLTLGEWQLLLLSVRQLTVVVPTVFQGQVFNNFMQVFADYSRLSAVMIIFFEGDDFAIMLTV